MNEDRFKFRVWDKGINDWVFQPKLKSDGSFYHSYDSYQLDKNLIIQQCTGLKDFQGKDIYEGDIVYCPWEDMNLLIKWNDESIGFIMGEYAKLTKFNSIVCHVIGNIFENKELLE